MDGDGSLDIAAVFPGQVGLYFNPGGAGFSQLEPLYTAGVFNARSLALRELDGDPDLAAPNAALGRVIVLFRHARP